MQQISGERLQDHWSSGFVFPANYSNFVKFCFNFIFNHMQIFKNAENDMFVVIKMIRTMKMEYLWSQASMVH